MTTLIKLEITRALRNKKFLFFSVIYPPALYLIIAGGADSKPIPGMKLDMALYFMVSMATLGALTAVLMGNSERIAKERETGWVRQLRLTALPGRGYVAAKMASAATVSLPSILLVMIVAAAVKGVRLEAWQWISIAAGTWLGSFVFAALGVAIGYLATGDAVRPITILCYFGLALLGGLWMPLTSLPQWAQNIAEWLPTHAYTALGTAIEAGGVPHVKDMAILAGYLLVFAGGAAWLYRKDTRKA
ncbi:ABC-2 type transport system permease protein [Streptomyces sp. 2224.1]|uniref:ABC transporter permease n=1 Tax=unclassified Streptomyces TaxID=2593676 RepID=UPI00088975C4|nr:MULTISPECIES: ABC transporter permease [unclassified Streptomyces]PBC84872.1 ABC-2 type transport system permease protein [Streptomyces sp. 2321.6]SDR25364.1 ABC-2 type transport system permease protein [Streptomyces sp. KS_16]SEB59809.1 ABC-2 type transport system permease protein [Streptomyces sp. 2224.1]SED47635.1 ABC-2 type transport system permease protein [Streptomyces sp. 2133.1]SNC70895.1 ABC-2 type transport system permease protein [Streptomyces sp. 2114.4]